MKIADLLTREGHASSWQAVNAGYKGTIRELMEW